MLEPTPMESDVSTASGMESVSSDTVEINFNGKVKTTNDGNTSDPIDGIVRRMSKFDEPCARRTIFASFRQAALDLWGDEGLLEIGARMSEEARHHCIDSAVIDQEMLPERFVQQWYEAAWNGPARRNRAVYDRFLDGMMDRGFGRVQKALLAFATPAMVARKAGQLWRHDHSHGTLVATVVGEKQIYLRLSDHPYVETPLARSSIAEIYRYAMSLARAKRVLSKHWLEDPRTLTVQIRWF